MAAASGERQYKIHKFLSDRDEWLDSKYDIPNDHADADANIKKWAMKDSVSTVRNIQTLECKKAVIRAHTRAISGDMPQHYPVSCPKEGEGKNASEKAPIVVMISNSKDVRRAENIIEIQVPTQLISWRPAALKMDLIPIPTAHANGVKWDSMLGVCQATIAAARRRPHSA